MGAARCQLCGEPDSLLHHYYECPEQDKLEDNLGILARTAFLKAEAKQQGHTEPALWFRGLLPHDHWKAPTGQGEHKLTTPMIFGDYTGVAENAGDACTDGSGGPEWVPAVARRAGTGGAAAELATSSDGQQ